MILVKFEDNGVIPDRDQVVQRNKMLVKGGSSFNALIRALKQDLVDR